MDNGFGNDTGRHANQWHVAYVSQVPPYVVWYISPGRDKYRSKSLHRDLVTMGVVVHKLATLRYAGEGEEVS